MLVDTSQHIKNYYSFFKSKTMFSSITKKIVEVAELIAELIKLIKELIALTKQSNTLVKEQTLTFINNLKP